MLAFDSVYWLLVRTIRSSGLFEEKIIETVNFDLGNMLEDEND